ncbi:methionine aminopeptidase [Aspergillus neoniger CBS 115656]|uniref:Methionine aminopeptidase n=1 Tax=Aspergillus neoniger (strain CBS 115656) TaxID=1448310 RepID=A0A318Y4N7_ASPNB|nr:methionine aminopeptidase [Aspergillus neoniger CBS 115656]PYH28407.1 methionine aminopeptidase [Aspergillus neoniger CBS 115656]
MTSKFVAKRRCLGDGCDNECSTLQCPTCLKLEIRGSFFCSQDCFQRSWKIHKAIHRTKQTILYNPFLSFNFTGSLRPVYPLSERRTVPTTIQHPDYWQGGIPQSAQSFYDRRAKFTVLDKAGQDAMRKVCRLAREVLDIAAAAIKPGVTTDYIDEIVHKACIERDSYPSPLNYNFFPKSVCTSLNEVICHGIPDQRVLVDGDILNIDVTLYHGGYHGDLNETYYVGDKAKADLESVRVVETARECLDMAIELVKPGALFRAYGDVIEAHARKRDCSVIRSFCGHGINSVFHCLPSVPHYAGNKAVGAAKEGMCFTIEPMVALGTYRDIIWPDNWTAVTMDGKRTAQFEHTLLVTADGVEVLTARLPTSPGGPVAYPVSE